MRHNKVNYPIDAEDPLTIPFSVLVLIVLENSLDAGSTRIRIHSTTKHFACLAYLLLCEEGRARIDDPIGKFLPDQLQGFRLEQGVYQPIVPENGRLTSEQLGLELLAGGLYLRFLDPTTGELIPTPEEVEKARQSAEAEVARLRAELEALRSGQP